MHLSHFLETNLVLFLVFNLQSGGVLGLGWLRSLYNRHSIIECFEETVHRLGHSLLEVADLRVDILHLVLSLLDVSFRLVEVLLILQGFLVVRLNELLILELHLHELLTFLWGESGSSFL